MSDKPVFIEVHAIPTQGTDPIRMVLNLRNVRSLIERADYTILESSATSIGTVHIRETWDEVAGQVRDGGVLGGLADE